ncbi:MAG: DUF1292 domain-containing protein [Oscillospiraceae bacterium]
MSEEYGPDFITIVDDDGNEIELEYVDALEHEGVTYTAFFPAVEEGADEEGEEYGLIILRSEEENGETYLNTVDDEELLETVYELFMQRFLEDEAD